MPVSQASHREVTFLYSVFGLSLRSNLGIPGLIPEGQSEKSPDVDVHLKASPGYIATSDGTEELAYTSSYTVESGEPALRVWKIADGGLLRLDYFDGVRFWLDRKGAEIWAQWPAEVSLEDIATYLLGPVCGLVLRLRGVPCLHASALSFGDFAVAFAGSEGAGKSTTAAALAQRGHAVVSDDIVALVERNGAFDALPAYPYLSLWPESVKIVYGAAKELPSFSATFDKRQLLLEENRLRFQREPLRLGAVFLLGERVADATAPNWERLSSHQALMGLVANSYATNLLDKRMRALEFEVLGRLAATVPVWRVRASEDGSRIGAFCDAISGKCKELVGAKL